MWIATAVTVLLSMATDLTKQPRRYPINSDGTPTNGTKPYKLDTPTRESGRTAAKTAKNSTKQPRFGAFSVPAGRCATATQKPNRRRETAAATAGRCGVYTINAEQLFFGMSGKGCIFATPKC
ncbi:MAG: hypothetical protein J5725_08255 [Bacteroidales bacterium]|nr:hypothetical protein [Bacteroidales bacterium]